MPDVLTALVQVGLLIAVAVAVRSRLLLIAVAAATVLGTVAYGVPESLSKTPEALAHDMTGVGVGLLIGWFVARTRDPKAKARTQRATQMQTGGSSSRRRFAWTYGVLVLLAGAGVAGWVKGGVPEPWRVTARGWVASVSATLTPASPATAQAAKPDAVANTGLASGTPSAKGSPHSQNTAHAERPRGDIRHCLEQGSRDQVARCAEKGR